MDPPLEYIYEKYNVQPSDRDPRKSYVQFCLRRERKHKLETQKIRRKYRKSKYRGTRPAILSQPPIPQKPVEIPHIFKIRPSSNKRHSAPTSRHIRKRNPEPSSDQVYFGQAWGLQLGARKTVIDRVFKTHKIFRPVRNRLGKVVGSRAMNTTVNSPNKPQNNERQEVEAENPHASAQLSV